MIELLHPETAPPEAGAAARATPARPSRRDCANRNEATAAARTGEHACGPRERDPVRRGEAESEGAERNRGPAAIEQPPAPVHGVTRSRNCSMRAGPMPGSRRGRRQSAAARGSGAIEDLLRRHRADPGSASSCSSVALARLTFAAAARRPPPAAAPGRRACGTTICWPSATGAARLTSVRSAGGSGRPHARAHRRPELPRTAARGRRAERRRRRRRRAGARAPRAARPPRESETACAAGARAVPAAARRLPTSASTMTQTTSRIAVWRRGSLSKIM